MEQIGANLLPFGASLGIGLLIGLERERNPSAKAGVRTFALVSLLGTLCAVLSAEPWLALTGLAAVAACLIAAYAAGPQGEDSGTTTVIAAAVCFLLGVLAGRGEPALAGALAIGVTALLYFKPEIEGFSAGLKRHEQVSVLQFLIVTFIVLPILPDRGYGPYGALNPRNIWLMVVLVSGIGLATYIALRLAAGRHGLVLTGILGGLLSSTAATLLYARRSRESQEMERLALGVVPLANLVPLVRVGLLASAVAPAILPQLLPVLGAALAGGLVVAAPLLRDPRTGAAPALESRNPAELGTALRFAALYAVVLLASAWLADLAGSRGLYVAALASGMVDIDPINLSALNFFAEGKTAAGVAVATICLAYLSNVAFKMAVLVWFNRRVAWRALLPILATVGAGGAALTFIPG
jgi:uncharacterized membrane protein (DUF4010 family)